MVQVEEEESAIIAEFLPQPLSEDELRDLVRAAIAETGAVVTGRPGQGDGQGSRRRSRAAPTARPCPTWCERSSAAEPMFIPRTLAETEGGGGRGPWARALIVGALLAASLWAIMSVNVATGQVNLAVGDVAQTEIRAPISRSFVSESQTNAAREEAADQVATVYVPIAPLADIVDQQLRAYDAVVGGITSTLEQRDAGALTDEEVPDELNRIAPQLTDEQVDRLSAISLIGWQRISDAGREVLEAVQSEEIRDDELTDAREQLRTNITQDLFAGRPRAGRRPGRGLRGGQLRGRRTSRPRRRAQAARNAVSDISVSVEQGETIVRAGDRDHAAAPGDAGASWASPGRDSRPPPSAATP